MKNWMNSQSFEKTYKSTKRLKTNQREFDKIVRATVAWEL